MSIVTKQAAQKPYILTLDVGSSSLRASLYDAQAHLIEGFELRTTYELAITPDGGVEKDPDELLAIVCTTLDALLAQIGPLAAGIGGVAVDTFWHSLLGIDAEQRPTTPVYTWADTRSAGVAQQLARETNESTLHSRTGCKLHPTYFPAKLRWLASVQPVIFRRTAKWLSFGEYLYLRLFGKTVCGLSMASGTGLLNQNRHDWDEEALALAGITAEQLFPLGDMDTPLSGLLSQFAARWPALKSVPWFPAIGDGAAGNLGSGCFAPDRIAVMVGTSGAMRVVVPANQIKIPWGLWCYQADRRRFVLGGALSEGGNFFAWTRQNFKLPSIEESEQELSRLEPDGHGLTVLPFLTGERSPGWNAQARAAIVGLSLDTTPLEILRAGLESIALRFGLIYELLEQNSLDARQIVASGGALLNSPTWMQILADVLNQPVIASAEGETTSRGAALLGLEQLGYPVDPALASNSGRPPKGDLSQASFSFGATYQPDPTRHARYKAALERQKNLYAKLIGSSKL